MFRSVLVSVLPVCRPNRVRGLVGFLIALFCAPVYGTIFDWPSGGWTAGSPAPGQTVSQSFTSINPNDISLSINNNGNSNQGGTWQSGYPQISASPLTGGFTGIQAVQLYVSSQTSNASYIRTTVTFDTSVINLSFEIWDVDAIAGQFADKISNIQALASGGSIVGPSSVTSGTPGYNTISGIGLSTVVLGTANAANNTDQGTIDITFSGPITQFSFDWSNNDPALGAQAIGLGSLTYTAVPETSTGWLVSLLSLVAVRFAVFQKRIQTGRY
jgi:hypothetical protein